MNKVAKAFSGAYCGYYSRETPPLVTDLAETGPGTPCGELMRRSWQPVCMSEELTDVPYAIRVLGEDLVAFRDFSGRVGVFHRQCAHRGASLEYGRIAEHGLRCCYHGWHFDVDGTLIDAPAEPADSPIRTSVCQPSYPALERHGLVFAYMGPPDAMPEFPELDSFCRPDTKIVPYSNYFPCNWLQVQENLMDPAHAVFLHARMGTIQLTAAWGANGTIDFVRNRDRMFYVHCRRVEENIWIRITEVGLPNFGQTAGLWEDGGKEKFFERAGITRWTIPIDDTHCWIYGYRYFNAELEANPLGKPEDCGRDKVDGYGQTGQRSYEEMQRNPGDWEVEVSQGPIANHNRENRGTSDLGLVMLRRHLRRAIEGTVEPVVPVDGIMPTYASNTVYHLPPRAGEDDEIQLREVGKKVGEILISADDLPYEERHRMIAERLRGVPASLAR
jgi:nitrite reductase/ring-hydroxylating ferredoxin subunit